MTIDDIDEFFVAYLDCALWSSTDNSNEQGGEPLDKNYDHFDIPQDVRSRLKVECLDFISSNASDLAELDAEQCGHDFWLTREHHGAGFWDRGLGEVGDRLTKASHIYGEAYPYVGDDGMVYFSGYEQD